MKNLIQNIRNILFDNKCKLCCENINDKELEICYNCFDKLKNEKNFSSFNSIYYIFNYSGEFRKLLLKYKNNSQGNLAKTIALLIKDEFFEVLYKEEIDIIIPVPINIKRNRKRGFNQVEEVLNCLKYRYMKVERTKNTQKMYTILNVEEREKNIDSVFSSNIDIKNKNILIVDDIVTTGSTVKELVKTIEKNAKAKKIVCFSFALSKTAKKMGGF